MKVPELKHYEGSWVIKHKASGHIFMETFDKQIIEMLDEDKYEVFPIGEHLASLNKDE